MSKGATRSRKTVLQKLKEEENNLAINQALDAYKSFLPRK